MTTRQADLQARRRELRRNARRRILDTLLEAGTTRRIEANVAAQRSQITEPAIAAAALTTVWVNTLYASHYEENK